MALRAQYERKYGADAYRTQRTTPQPAPRPAAPRPAAPQPEARPQQQEHRRQQSNQFFHLELSVSCLSLYSTILMA